MAGPATEIRIGTAGWHYKAWTGRFYPQDSARTNRLSYYAERFASVEINNSFYQLPSTETLTRWREQTPDTFLFACKASRFITHMKKLKDPKEHVARFFEVIDTLGDKLGPVLFQLPPKWRVNVDRLAEFLLALPAQHRYAFEFRDPSWFDAEVFSLLEEHACALCIYGLAGNLSPVEVTTDFVYVRLHGPGDAYQGDYDGRTLRGWARRLAGWRDDGRAVYCYFDNDEKAYAVTNALQLQEMVETG